MNPELSPEFQPPNQSFKSGLIEFIQFLVIFAVFAVVIYFFVARPHKVVGLSMYPNFHSGDYIITDELTYHFQAPQRGQVIVFEYPLDKSQDFIKRIIGLPGEKVKIQDHHVYINDKLLKEPYLDPSVPTDVHEYPPIAGQDLTVPAGDYFVMGDNRPDSSDSRSWGFITKDDIIGMAFFRYWPEDSIGLIPTVHYPPLQ